MKLAKELDKVTQKSEKETMAKEYRAFLDHKEKRGAKIWRHFSNRCHHSRQRPQAAPPKLLDDWPSKYRVQASSSHDRPAKYRGAASPRSGPRQGSEQLSEFESTTVFRDLRSSGPANSD